MLRNLFKRFSTESRTAPVTDSQVARHWENFHSNIAEKQLKWTDWGDHPRVIQLIQQEAFGGRETNLFDYLKREHPDLAGAHALSLCCGTGAFEKSLIENAVFSHVTGVDISSVLIERANENVGSLDKFLQFEVADVNQGDFGNDRFDVVFAKAALHHVENLESLLSGIHKCLTPGGKLIALDFFGPTRFQWTDQQLEAANKMIQSFMPDALRQREDGSRFVATRPTIEQMIEMDPSEAVRSSELAGVIEKHFKEVRWLDIGGTILNLVLDGSIINSFDENNSEHNKFIDTVFQYERKLLASGVLDSDFRIVTAGL